MYRAVELATADKDLHRFVWRSKPDDPLLDYRMTRITFGVSASFFATNMSVNQNSLDFETEYPQATQAVKNSFYVDDGLTSTGADSVDQAIQLQGEWQESLWREVFYWNSSDPTVLENVTPELKDAAILRAVYQDPRHWVERQ